MKTINLKFLFSLISIFGKLSVLFALLIFLKRDSAKFRTQKKKVIAINYLLATQFEIIYESPQISSLLEKSTVTLFWKAFKLGQTVRYKVETA